MAGNSFSGLVSTGIIGAYGGTAAAVATGIGGWPGVAAGAGLAAIGGAAYLSFGGYSHTSDIKSHIRRMGINNHYSDEQIEEMLNKVYEISSMKGVKTAPDEIVTIMENYQKASGNLDGINENMEVFARAHQVWGGSPENEGIAMGTLARSYHVRNPEDIREIVGVGNAFTPERQFILTGMRLNKKETGEALHASGRKASAAFKDLSMALNAMGKVGIDKSQGQEAYTSFYDNLKKNTHLLNEISRKEIHIMERGKNGKGKFK